MSMLTLSRRSKPINVRVTTMDAELEFAIQPQTTGKQLFDQVVKTIGLREVWFFGLQYVDTHGLTAWLKMTKKVASQDVRKETPLQFRFRAKFYPEDVVDELIQDITQRLFYLQTKDAILTEACYCPPETSVLLASYAVQVKYGDQSDEIHPSGFLRHDRLLPSRVVEQHRLSREQWEERVSTWHKEHRGMLREEAMSEYLKVAQDLEMYGVNYFPIRNKKGTELWLGVDALGLNVYELADKLSPKVGFPWSEIRNISFHDKKFVIKPIDRRSIDFVFYSSKLRINKRVLALCMGNHELYMRRRKPDSIEVQQMKQQARDARQARERERTKLAREKTAREEADRAREEMAARLKAYEEDARAAMVALARSEALAHELEAKVRAAEAEAAERERMRLEIERLHREAREQIAELQAENARHTAEERAELEAAAAKAQAAAAAMAEVVETKEREAAVLSEQLEEAKREQVERAKALMSATSQPPLASPGGNGAAGISLGEGGPDESVVDDMPLGEEPRTPMQGRYPRSASAYGTPIGADGTGTPSQREDFLLASRQRLEETRSAMMSKSEKIRDQLARLGSDLDALKSPEKLTPNDKLHQKRRTAGLNKFKTLRRIRQGNTQQRVMDFESL